MPISRSAVCSTMVCAASGLAQIDGHGARGDPPGGLEFSRHLVSTDCRRDSEHDVHLLGGQRTGEGQTHALRGAGDQSPASISVPELSSRPPPPPTAPADLTPIPDGRETTSRPLPRFGMPSLVTPVRGADQRNRRRSERSRDVEPVALIVDADVRSAGSPGLGVLPPVQRHGRPAAEAAPQRTEDAWSTSSGMAANTASASRTDVRRLAVEHAELLPRHHDSWWPRRPPPRRSRRPVRPGRPAWR